MSNVSNVSNVSNDTRHDENIASCRNRVEGVSIATPCDDWNGDTLKDLRHVRHERHDIFPLNANSLLRAFDETGKAPPIIQPVGETLSSLAARAGVTVEQLREAIDDKENADLIDRLNLRGDVLTVAPMEQPESNGPGDDEDDEQTAARNGPDSSFADVLPVGSEESL